MRKTTYREEVVEFTCDHCGKIESVKAVNEHPGVPLGWIQLMAHDMYISIEGKSVSIYVEIQACTQACLFKVLEERIDEALSASQ
jgi:hypothetical protein